MRRIIGKLKARFRTINGPMTPVNLQPVAVDSGEVIQDIYRDRSSPIVTVVVPLYNEERFVAECLDSVLCQSMDAWQCIIVDDCSTDRSLSIVREYAAQDSRFRIVCHDSNQGLSAARNSGLSETITPFVTFLDSDDYLFSDSLWRRVTILESIIATVDDVAGAFCQLVHGPEDGPQIQKRDLTPLKGKPRRVDFLNSMGECPFNVHAPVLRTDVLKKTRGFDENMRHGAEDWDLWNLLLRNGYRFFSTNTYGGVYRQKRSSMARTLAHHHCEEAMRIFNQYYDTIDERDAIPDAPYLYKYGFGYYQKSLSKARRLIGYATLAYLGGDKSSLEKVLARFDLNSWHYLYHKLPIRDLIMRSAARFHCLDYGIYRQQGKSRLYAQQEEEIYSLIKTAATSTTDKAPRENSKPVICHHSQVQ